jgi:LCP family protein required for cell wall assembly
MRILGWSGAFLGVIIVAAGSFAFYEYHKISNNIHRVDALATNDPSIKDAAKQLNAENFLLIGSDTRAGANERYGQVGGQRSDTTILAHLSPDRQHATMISFPRDAWVTIPPCQTAASQVIPEHDGMFNSAFEAGGPNCTVRTLQRLTGISITHYVQVDFTGFKSMVDALGGVPVCSAGAVADRDSGLKLRAGNQMLRGEQALAFVRARHAMGDGSDLDRIKRQQLFLGSMMRVATGHRILFNPVQLTRFLEAASRSVTLDRRTTLTDLRQLAGQLRGLDPKRVTFLTAPIANRDYDPTGQRATGGGRVLLDAAQGELLWQALINDKAATKGSSRASGPAATTVTLPPEQVSVRVLNGVGSTGLAGQVASALSNAGFLPTSTGNASIRATSSVVRYAPANRDAAVTLAAAVPGSVLSADPTLGPAVELLVGTTYRGVQPVRVGQRLTLTQAAPSTAPSAPKVRPSPQPSINGGTSSCV